MTTFIRHRLPAYFLGFTDEETGRAARAYFDDSAVLLASTAGAAQQLNGFRVDQPDLVRCHIGYFEQLWAEADRL